MLAHKSGPGQLPRSGPDENEDDTALLVRVAAGEAEAFRGLVDRHLPTVLAVARRMLKDDAEAEDVAKETLLRLWRNAAGLELGPHGVRPWLRRVVSNLCIDRVRARRNTTVMEAVPEEIAPATQVRQLAERELGQRVDAALKALPERQRLALTLFHYEGMSQIEVGDVMGISDEAVESLLARARRTLKTALKEVWRGLMPESEPAGQLRHLAERELGARVDAALKALPERQRLALTLFHYEGMSQVEVGAAMAISDEAVESLLARARRTLKSALKDEWRSLMPESEL